MNCVPRVLCFGALLGAAALVTAGCTAKESADKKPQATSKDKKADAHEHPEKGPHGGALAEWGEEEYHVEFTADRAKKQVTVYLLDGNAKKAKPINAQTVTLTLKKEKPPVQVKLTADPQQGDPPGSASRFVGTHDKFAAELDPDELDVSGEVSGKPYEGTFKEADHKHEKK